MTAFSSTVPTATNASNAIVNWVQFVHDTLINGGWVDPGDSGQVTIAGMTTPGGANTKAGYRIYRMDDALQAMAPVFMRLDFGSSAGANVPGMWVTIGGGSNGSGTITTISFNGGAVATPTVSPGNNASAATTNSYGSAAPNRAHFALFAGNPNSQGFLWSIERAKTAGVDNGHGLLMVWGFNQATNGDINRTAYVVLGGGGQPTVQVGVPCVLSNVVSGGFSGDISVGLAICFLSAAAEPGTGVCFVNSGDFSAEAQFTMSVYGQTRTYQLTTANNITAIPAGNGTRTLRANTLYGIRYD